MLSETLVDYKIDDPYEYRVKDLKSAVNKEYLNKNFLKKDARGKYFDLQGYVVKNSEPYYDDLHDENDLVSKKICRCSKQQVRHRHQR